MQVTFKIERYDNFATLCVFGQFSKEPSRNGTDWIQHKASRNGGSTIFFGDFATEFEDAILEAAETIKAERELQTPCPYWPDCGHENEHDV